jgi:DNA-binding SARP family transcriptional activator
LWRLGPAGVALVRCDGQELSLDPHVVVDIDIAARAAREVLAGAGSPLPATALETLRADGELLADWYDDWVIFERERFRQLRLHALEELCSRLSGEGHHAMATDAGLAAIASEPLRESAHRVLIGAHLREGNAGEALRQYNLCSDLLRRELGLAPSAALEQLVAHLHR